MSPISGEYPASARLAFEIVSQNIEHSPLRYGSLYISMFVFVIGRGEGGLTTLPTMTFSWHKQTRRPTIIWKNLVLSKIFTRFIE
jgi:hypothetical protein